MFVRRFAGTCAATGALALTLLLAVPAAAADGDLPELPAAMPAAPDVPAFPPPAPVNSQMPQWQGTAAPVMQLDARARDAWLSECRRRTAYYYDSGWGHKHRRHKRDRDHDMGGQGMGHRGGYDYCEAYLDDYYRYYSQSGVAYGQVYMAPVHYRPMQMTMMPAQTQVVSEPVEEVVTEEYVPTRTRFIPRRPARKPMRDKRIRVY